MSDPITVKDLVADPANPRTMSAENEERLLRVMAEYGDLANPTFNRRLGKLVGGHQRLRLLRRQYGDHAISIVPREGVGGSFHCDLIVRRFEGDESALVFPLRVVDWDEAKHKAAMVAANSPDVTGEYDVGKVRDVMDWLGEAYDPGLLGFSADRVEEWTAPEPADKNAHAEDDVVPAVDPALVERWQPRSGGIWDVLDAEGKVRHRVMCGDSENEADVAMLLDGATPHLCVTDPPYGVKYDPTWRDHADLGIGDRSKGAVKNDDRADWRIAFALFPGDVVYCWFASLFFDVVKAQLVDSKFAVRSHIIWNKQHFALSRGHYHWKHENVLYAVKQGGDARWIGGRDKCTVWDIKNNNSFGNADAEERFGHGTQKPVECMARPIQHHEGDVYDPFAGTGTTLVAAQGLGRKSYMMEIDPDYCAVILERASRLGMEVRRAA